MRSIHLLAIDPQNDFCDPNGSLYVPGADEDSKRLAGFVTQAKDKLDDIHITMDSHNRVDISHPIWWKDSSGNHPSPFTVITAADVKAGTWTTTQAWMQERSLAYLEALETGGRYPHVIWPYHCLIGSEGGLVYPELFNAVQDWTDRFAKPDFVAKGSNPWTEHFSAVRAEVPDPQDPGTQINTAFIQTLEQADDILLAGQALSHCVANTMRDIADNFSDPAYLAKVILLTDCSSNVPTFEQLGDDFVRDMRARGMRVSTTSDYLAQL
jgi:nicotinamidase-related amidase